MSAFGIPSGFEFWIILIVALLLFGHRIPGMARSLGSGIVEFKKGLRSGERDDEQLPPPKDSETASSGSVRESEKIGN